MNYGGGTVSEKRDRGRNQNHAESSRSSGKSKHDWPFVAISSTSRGSNHILKIKIFKRLLKPRDQQVKTAQHVKVLVVKADNRSSIPGPHVV